MKIIDDHIIEFRTVEPWYSREKNGEKKNTVRRLERTQCIEFINVLFHLTTIRIVCPEITETDKGTNGNYIKMKVGDTFERTLTDVSYFDGVFIFSWG